MGIVFGLAIAAGVLVAVARMVFPLFAMLRHNPAIVCPYCYTQGQVATWPEERKHGISGAKATGAVLTGGASVLFTGLSQKQKVLAARCDNCLTSWTIE